MNHRIIIVDGQSTVGKSSISKAVYEQLNKYEPCIWLHEECSHNPIREGEFEAGDLQTVEGMELNKKDMLSKWTNLRDSILEKNCTYVMEGCFLHAIDRYLIKSIWDFEEMKKYFSEIRQILHPLNPLYVFVYRPDIKTSFEKAFVMRGDWWKNLTLKVPEKIGYFRTHQYTGDDSIFDQIAYEQEKMAEIFALITEDHLEIDTTTEDWNAYSAQIIKKEGHMYVPIENANVDYCRLCGTYRLLNGNDQWKISYDDEKQQLFTSLFWPYMPMKCTEENVCELISFPVCLRFSELDGHQQFIVEGNYDWEYNGKTFIKETE